MFCSQCGSSLIINSMFCHVCGKESSPIVPHSVSIVLQSHQRLPRQQQQDRQFQQRQYQPVSRGYPCLFKNTVNGKSKNEARGSNPRGSKPK